MNIVYKALAEINNWLSRCLDIYRLREKDSCSLATLHTSWKSANYHSHGYWSFSFISTVTDFLAISFLKNPVLSRMRCSETQLPVLTPKTLLEWVNRWAGLNCGSLDSKSPAFFRSWGKNVKWLCYETEISISWRVVSADFQEDVVLQLSKLSLSQR